MSNNVLEFYLKMKDMMSSGLAAVARTGKASMQTLGKAVEKVQTALDFAKKKGDTLGSSLSALKTRAKQLQQTIDNSTNVSNIRAARRELEALQKQINSHPATTQKGGGNGGGLLSGLLSRLAPAAMLAGALSFGSGAVQAASRYEATNKSFEVLTANKKTGGELASNLNQLQQNTILGPEVFKGAQTMLAFGVTADKVLPSVKMLGDVAMGDAERFNSLALAFSQVTAAGKLQGQDLLQFVNAGFNPLQEIAKQTGKSMAVLRAEMSEGAISSEMVAKAFETATSKGGLFYQMMDKMAETTSGKQAQLSGTYEAMKIAVGERLTPAVNHYTEALTGMVNTVKGWFAIPASEKMAQERFELGALVSSITRLNEGNDIRRKMLGELISKYPELYGHIDAEKVKNSELLKTLDEINAAYQRRIDLAVKGEMNTEAQQEAASAWKDYLQASVNDEKLKKMLTPEDYAKQNRENYGLASNSIRNRENALARYKAAIDAQKKSEQELANEQHRYDANEILNFKNFTVFKGHKKELTEFEGFKSLVRTMGGQYLQSNDASKYLAWMQGNFGKKNASSIVSEDGGKDKDKKGKGESIARGIAGSGPRTINIYGVKFTDKIENYFNGATPDMDELERKMYDMFLRVLNSGANVES